MKWSIKLGSFSGIAVYLHWTFAILIAWIFLAQMTMGGGVASGFSAVGYVLALFGCVLLHEFGHALTAKRYGVNTRDIILLPIGGLARLERIPTNPKEEFWIAIAGPAVNVAIAAILFVTLMPSRAIGELLNFQLLQGNLWARLIWVNIFLAAFNLLPAFPMDGGRILRALLAIRLGRNRATSIASNVGQIMAILFGIIGFMYNPLLIFIAIFVFLGAQAEANMVQTVSLIEGLKVQDAMMTRFRSLSASDSVATAARELLAGSQQDFPVLHDDSTWRLLLRKDLITALAEGRRDDPVGGAASGDGTSVDADASLEEVLERMRQENRSSLPVLKNGQLVGLLSLENIAELVMIRGAVSKQAQGGRVPEPKL